MITGAHAILYSTDAEADRAFLRDVLDLPFVDAGHGWLIFALPPAELGVHPAEGPNYDSGVRHDEMPVNQSDFHHAKPVYELLDGWWEDLSECRTFEDLPAAAQAYVLRVEELIGARVSAIGVGPGRDEIIERHPLKPAVAR